MNLALSQETANRPKLNRQAGLSTATVTGKRDRKLHEIIVGKVFKS